MSFKNDGETKTFSDKQKWKFCLQEILKRENSKWHTIIRRKIFLDSRNEKQGMKSIENDKYVDQSKQTLINKTSNNNVLKG